MSHLKLETLLLFLSLSFMGAGCGTDVANNGNGGQPNWNNDAQIKVDGEGPAPDSATTDADNAGDAGAHAQDAMGPAQDAASPTLDSATTDDGGSGGDTGSSTELDAGGSPDVTSADAQTDAGGGPAPGCCAVTADCAANQVCFFGPFKAGKCMFTNNLGPKNCWTDAQCGEKETCEGATACGCDAFCKMMDKPGICQSSDKCAGVSCDDKNLCTMDSCDPTDGKCIHKSMAGDPCDDGDACTKGDLCVDKGGVPLCAPGKPHVCNNSDPCKPEICNPQTGACDTKPAPPGCGSVGKTCAVGMGPVEGCDNNTFCKLTTGECSGFGKCAVKPTICLGNYAPVCGCNGKTYSNECKADSEGAHLKSTGSCGGGVKCCKNDGECGKSQDCVGAALGSSGVCKDLVPLSKDQCWSDAQCTGKTCIGPTVCPCGAMCLMPDKPGTCQ